MFPHCPLPRHITALYVFTVVNSLSLCTHMALVGAEVVVEDKSNSTQRIYPDLPAEFGPRLPLKGLRGKVVYAHPGNACLPVQMPPALPEYTGNWILLAHRFGCNFDTKVRMAQNASYSAVIVHNVGSNALETMWADHSEDIYIPAVFIGQDDGDNIRKHYQYTTGSYVVLVEEPPINFNSYLLPFAIVVGISFLIMLMFMIVKCIKDHRRQRRHRLPTSSLRKIPTSKFKRGDPYETCAICLEDYTEGEKLRILPCAHAYHCKCIDPWLTKNKRVCPVCKRKVFAQDEHFSDSESDSDDETAPLLHPGGYGTQGGTFVPQAENPFQRARSRSNRSDEDSSSGDGSLENGSGRMAGEEDKESEEKMEEAGAMGYSNEGFAQDKDEEYFSAESSHHHSSTVMEEDETDMEDVSVRKKRREAGSRIDGSEQTSVAGTGMFVSTEHSINNGPPVAHPVNTPIEIAIEATITSPTSQSSSSSSGHHRRSDLVI